MSVLVAPRPATTGNTASASNTASTSSRPIILNGSLIAPPSPSSSSSNLFLCPHPSCTKSYSKSHLLSQHLLSHSNTRTHACPHQGCDATFLRSSHLEQHARTHLGEEDKPFACEEEDCVKRFWTRQHLERHRKRWHAAAGPSEREGERESGRKGMKCPQCPTVFTKKHLLRAHLLSSHSSTQPCAPSTSSTTNLTTSAPSSSPSDSLLWLPFPCPHPTCPQRFPTAQKLSKHSKTHDLTRYVCARPSCSAKFGTWSALQAHVRDEHPRVCPHPDCVAKAEEGGAGGGGGRKVFASNAGLKRHLERHGEKEVLAREEMDVEVEESEKEDGGEVVPGSGTGQGSGSGPGPGPVRTTHACPEPSCNRTFKSTQGLTRHLSTTHSPTHLTRAHLPCPYAASSGCTFTAARRYALDRHVRVEHPSSSSSAAGWTKRNKEMGARELLTGVGYAEDSERRWKCPVGNGQGEEEGEEEGCEYAFKRAYDLKRHLESVHKVVMEEEEWKALKGKGR